MSDELKPCPFCGGDKIKQNNDDGQFWATCQKCFADGPPTSKRSDEGATDWNTRAQAQAAPEAEPVEVVAYLVPSARMSHEGWEDGPTQAETSECVGERAMPCYEPLMTVAQHNRIMASAPQHDAELVELLRSTCGLCTMRDMPTEHALSDLADRIDAKLATLSAKNEGGKA